MIPTAFGSGSVTTVPADYRFSVMVHNACTIITFATAFRPNFLKMPREQWLAEINYDAENAHYEGYQYVPTKVEKDLGGGKRFPRYQAHPAQPSGKSWDEDKVDELYPNLAKKYSYSVTKRRPWWQFLAMPRRAISM